MGRSGAGKSTFCLSMFRILEPVKGWLKIDGENVALMGMESLRKKLTIIPQDPVLFSGTLRTNIDPFYQFSDRDVWKAIELAHLLSFVSQLKEGIHHTITRGGSNLSAGQRQQVCLARALLQKTKILILDEATAAMDCGTDKLIQDTIKKEFADCTVITIAHRINTVMESDRVIVLDKGTIAEFDKPEKLVKNKTGTFYALAVTSGYISQ